MKELLVEPGDQVEVGEVIMELEEDKSQAPKENTKDQKPEEASTAEKDQTKDLDVDHNTADVLALPKVRKKAEEKGINLEELDVEGRIRMEDLEGVSETKQEEVKEANKGEKKIKTNSKPVSTPEDVKATPSVRKIAREKGIDISKVKGSGRGGKITREDVLSYSEEEETQDRQDSEIQKTAEDVSGEELSGLEKNVARKMTESRFSAPHVTHVEKVDMTELVELREKANSEVDPHLTYMPFIMKASILAMKSYPRTNAHFDGGNMEVDVKENYNFNVAVDTERGLLVPRIDSIGEKNLLELARDMGETVEKAQNGDLERSDMSPGSFSITNLGVIGGEEFTPIINPPQTCILGIGKIQETAEVLNGEVVPRRTMKLSFSYDHRVIDGATAARFINEIKENLENPEEMMVEI
ncbi:pyruvate dehydrogenase E2 component (dihydrolipoamide acetyltransferase) [Candidatus Nanohalobium constans]|uniref:Pyruvate dehydrogenase E2 component (Dihydrolipoamide acetyltransferase) n=1 Tax=Candidatus Nanohalobium constans TaxID=2565781 RepID=A0A5Q0UEG9_9ARCH|nr:pyruvate dehydrogenase E2 component (dihydrolipoamide acetyltransferase) [Candidatus Nanohalobium constans]